MVRTFATWDGVEQSADDLGRKFNNTYIRCLTPIDTKPVTKTVRFFEERSVYLNDPTKRQNERHLTSDVQIVCHNPAPAVYTLKGGGIAIVRRVPARQWAEGLCAANTAVFINGELNLGWGFEVADQLYADQYDMPLEQALAAVKPGEHLRLNSKYWIRSSKTDGNTELFRRHTRIGSWAAGQFFWAPKGKILKEEVKDELRFYV